MSEKKKTLERNDELEIKHLSKHYFGRTPLSSFIRENTLQINLQLTITNYRTVLNPKEQEMMEIDPVNVHIITDDVAREHVARSVCFGVAPIHHKVAFCLPRDEIISDFHRKVVENSSFEIRAFLIGSRRVRKSRCGHENVALHPDKEGHESGKAVRAILYEGKA